jgi:stage III sporulation protein AE
MKKLLVLVILIWRIFTPYDLVLADSFASEEEGTEESDENLEDFTQMEDLLEEKCNISYTGIYRYIKSGDTKGLAEYIYQAFRDSVVYEIRENNGFMVMIIGVIMLGSIFSNMSGKLGGYASMNGFFVAYLVLISLLLYSFLLVTDLAEAATGEIVEYSKAFIPAYLMAAGYANGGETAAMSYEIMIFVIYLCENVLGKIVLPVIKCYAIVGLVSKINQEDSLSKTAGLLKSTAGWLLKLMLAFVTGLNLIKGLIAPSVDKVERNSFYKIMSALPGGSGAEAIGKIFIATGVLIKNCIGVAAAIAIILVALIPVIKIWIIYISLRVTSALVQPLGDKRFSEGVGIMAQAVSMVLRGVATAVLMFVLSIMLFTILGKGE